MRKRATETVSLSWFRNIVNSRDLKLPKYNAVRGKDDSTGKMLLYRYDPKTRDQLPYYDTLPIIIHCGTVAGGFYGMNLHYLPVNLRIRFLDRISELGINMETQTLTPESLMLIVTHPYFKPCMKRYLSSHVVGRMVQVPIEDWDKVAMLPLQRFKKETARTVWEDTKRMLNDKPDQT